MSAQTITPVGPDPSTTPTNTTDGDIGGGGAGRGGAGNGTGSPLVVVQQPRAAAPPRPAPDRSRANSDNSLRNGYAAISHSVSGETAAIGLGFLLGGPIGAIIGGTVAPAALAALMWRSRNAEHDDNSNDTGTGSSDADRSGSRGDRSGGAGNQGRGNGRSNGHGSGGGRNKTPKGTGNDSSGGLKKKPKTKDPIADKLGKLGKDLGNKLKNRGDKHGTDSKVPKHGKDDKAGKALKGSKDPKAPKDGSQAKGLKDGLRDGSKGLLKDRGKQSASERPWRGRGDKPEKPKKDRKDKKKGSDDDTSAASARDGLDPKGPRGPKGGAPELEQVHDGELVGDGSDLKPAAGTEDEIVDAEIVDDGLEAKAKKTNERIQLVRDKREANKRRAAIRAGKKAAEKAARDGDLGDPHEVKLSVLRKANKRIDVEIHHEDQRLALVAAVTKPRSTPVNYPAVQAAPTGTRQAGVAIARQVDPRTSTAYAILRALAEQLARGMSGDEDADMGDHIVELAGIPNMCKDLSKAVQEAANALSRTAPLHPTVMKHLNNASVAARTAGAMADNIMIVFVQAHREDIFRILAPRVGEERWNIRNAQGTLDAAKLRAAIMSSQQRLALPSGSSTSSGSAGGRSKLVPAPSEHTGKLITLMKGFNKGHMTAVLSEVAGSATGVEVVADSIGKLVKRMVNTWPTEHVVDDTVARTAGQVRRVSTELKLAIKAAQKAHARELRLNSKGRAGKGARAERKWDALTRNRNN